MHDDEAAGYWNLGSRGIEKYLQEALHSLPSNLLAFLYGICTA